MSTLEEVCWESIEDNNFSKTRFFIQKGTKTDKILESGISIIHLLSGKEGLHELLELCLKHGGSPNISNQDGITPIHLAAIWGQYSNLSTLLKYHADPNSIDNNGLNALDYALQSTESQAALCAEHLKSILHVERCSNELSYNKRFEEGHYHDRTEGNSSLRLGDYEKIYPSLTLDSTQDNLNSKTKCHQSKYTIVKPRHPALNNNQHHPSSSTVMHRFHGDDAVHKEFDNSEYDRYMTEDNTSISDLSLPIDDDIFSKEHTNYTSKDQYSLMTEDNSGLFSSSLDSSLLTENIEESKGNSLSSSDMCSTFIREGFSESTCSPATRSAHNTLHVDEEDIGHFSDEKNNKFLPGDASRSLDSFYTACEGDLTLGGGLDDTLVSFPKLHPWTVLNVTSSCLDDTLIDSMENLNVDNSHNDNQSSLQDSSHIPNNESLLDGTVLYDWKEYSIHETSIADASLQIPEPLLALNCAQIKQQLQDLGDNPGPVREDTKTLYIKRLARLKCGISDEPTDKLKEFLPEVRAAIVGQQSSPEMDPVEESMLVEFTKRDKRDQWREGTEKSSFNYLLLDPRVTQNLPARSKTMSYEDVFHTFVAGVFYVGKGKRSRPYAHLYEAANKNKVNRKLNQIRAIWSAGLGVVSLHCFQGVIPVEAYTREACMVDALGLSRLTNKKKGDYYGRAKSWSIRKKRQMGVFLIKKALQIFLNEGERQLHSEDLKMK